MTTVTQCDGVTIFELGPSYDSLDHQRLEQFGTLLTDSAETAAALLIDMSATEFIGSRFLELLVRAWRRISDRGGRLALCGVQPFCAEVLHVTRLDTLWECHADQPAALIALRAEA